MPSAANGKSDKPASTEATDNSPIRQILTIVDHKIRNLEKRKSKLTSYRDLQKAGKELKADQKVAVTKYDEVTQTLEFARDLSKQMAGIALSAEREAKKQAKKDAWVRYAADTNKIREVLLVLDCLTQLGTPEARDDFLKGTNGAAKLTEEDLKILDDLYPEVTPKHELNEEGQPGFHIQATKAAEHLYAIIDGKPKEILGTTYTHIKEIVTAVHDCGYFDKTLECVAEPEEEPVSESGEPLNSEPVIYAAPLPVPPAPAVVPPPAYPLRPIPPITLQEVEHAYFSQQYPQQRPISEVIGSQNFFFLQESEIDSPVATPQPPQVLSQTTSPMPIPTQTFTNQHYVQISARVPPDAGALPIPQGHFAPHPEHPAYPVPIPAVPVPAAPQTVAVTIEAQPLVEDQKPSPVAQEDNEDQWKENESPDYENSNKTQGGQGDGQNRFRRYGRGRPPSNGYRGRGGFNRQNSDYNRYNNDYQGRPKEGGYRQYNDGYQRNKEGGYGSRNNDNYYSNGEFNNNSQGESNGSQYSGFKSRGRGGRGNSRPPPRPRAQYRNNKDSSE